MSKNINKSKIYMIIGICILCISVLGSTVAYYREVLFTSDISTITYGLDYYINYTKGQDIESAILNSSSDYTGGNSADIEFWKKDNTYDIYGHIYLDINEIGTNLSQSSALKYSLVNNGIAIAEGQLKGNSSGDSILISSNIPLQTTKQLYTIYIWLDENEFSEEISIEKDALSLTVRCEATMQRLGWSTNLLRYIKKLYITGRPTLITQSKSDGTSDTYYYSYQTSANTWGLMNDGLKIDNTLDAKTTGLATTVTDATALTSGAEGNIRYFGPSDSVNNYIYFNCETYPDTNCELWRIIGIVDGKVKIIRNDSIGNLAWDQDKNQDSSLTTYNNNWKTSSLQEFLNGLYYNRETKYTHTYYSGSDGATTTTLYLSDIGITEATRNNNLISESTWYLGGKQTTSGLYPNDIYKYERQNKVASTIYGTNDFTINKNIGLMYASDYGYGTDLTKCSKDIYNYDTVSACKTGNWLFNSTDQWLITPRSSYPEGAWNITESGYISSTRVYDYVYNTGKGVRPVLYLNSELRMELGHEGTSTDPYRISIS